MSDHLTIPTSSVRQEALYYTSIRLAAICERMGVEVNSFVLRDALTELPEYLVRGLLGETVVDSPDDSSKQS